MSPSGDGMVDEWWSTASVRVIAPNSGIVCELFEGRVHAEFCLFHTGDQHLVTVNEVLQFCETVLNAIAAELQEPVPSKPGPRAVELLWTGEQGPMEKDC